MRRRDKTPGTMLAIGPTIINIIHIDAAKSIGRADIAIYMQGGEIHEFTFRHESDRDETLVHIFSAIHRWNVWSNKK